MNKIKRFLKRVLLEFMFLIILVIIFYYLGIRFIILNGIISAILAYLIVEKIMESKKKK